ncbi:MAG: aminopeptidase P family protein [Candidatus Rokubacteria bacterium]|nr:aminopeptidase P family protein [Candidatus Rokubacteria bacterium]
MTPTFAAFTEAEHRERLARARARLKEAGFDCCICVAPEQLYYLAGYDSWVSVNSLQALVFMVDGGEPTLVLRNVDLMLALETSWVRDIRTYQLHLEDAPALIAGVAREKGQGGGRVAMEMQSCAVPYSLGLRLAEALTPACVEDSTELLGDLRVVKSDREMAYLREAARYAAIGLEAARQALRPGITEIMLAGRLEAAMRAAGSDFWAIPTELASGPRTPGGHATPRHRVIEPGDLVHLEFAGVARRYHATAVHTMAAGDPGPRAREIYRLTRESLRAGIRAIRPGVPVAAVEEASLEPLQKEGLERYAMMRFGYGIGVAYPPIWLETLQISRGFTRVLEPGMAFVLHACIELVEEGIGVIQGGTYALSHSGLEMLVGGGDVELQIV